MKIGLFSDIHLEHHSSKTAVPLVQHIIESAKSQGVELLINAGDTHADSQTRQYVRDLAVNAGMQYFDVCGNHDLYGLRWDNVFNQVRNYQFGDIRVVASPMWTDFNHDQLVVNFAKRNISDFFHIDYVSPGLMQAMFKETIEMIDLMKPDLVVTHFAPSPESVHPRWAGQLLNGYFCPNALGQLKHFPKFWLHGHIHDPMEYAIGSIDPNEDLEMTRVIANPFGYPGETYQSMNDYNVKVFDV